MQMFSIVMVLNGVKIGCNLIRFFDWFQCVGPQVVVVSMIRWRIFLIRVFVSYKIGYIFASPLKEGRLAQLV